MNALKNVLFFGLLLAVLCGVYLSLNRSPEPQLPPGLSGDTTKPNIDLGQQMGPPVTNIPGQTPGNPPVFPTQPPPLNAPPADPGGAAPPFQPSVTAGTTNAAPPWPSREGANTLPPPPPLAPPPSDKNYPQGRDPFARGNGNPPSPDDHSPVTLPPPPADHPSSTSLDSIMLQVDLKVKENRFADALLILSQLHNSPDLPASQTREVTLILDQLAAKVIYSREHLLESQYFVQSGDTLDSIGEHYQVPGLLLGRINGIRDPQILPPGKELKVIKGPFHAQISTDRSEMTMWLADRYAGRFNVVLSNDLSHAANLITTVRDKRATSAGGSVGGSPRKQWIELGNPNGNISMQGINDTQGTAGRDNRNSIWLSEQDMDDVFGILSVGSRVIIQR